MRRLTFTGLRRAVVVAPHSDDETIAALYTIQAMRARGCKVEVIVATDGAASHRASRTHPWARRVAMRRAETLSAMAMAGLPRSDVMFLDLPDGGTRSIDAAMRRRALQKMRCRPRPDLVITPSHWDDHPDHREIARLCDVAWPPRIRRLSYIVWPKSDAPVTPAAKRVGLYGRPLRKRAVLGCYRSQLGAIQDDPTGFSLTRSMVRRMCGPREGLTS